ncbi:aminotransferase class I/II-fold pyridoxal phosphate-dependent enzyme [Candidatus Woesebacteria bacterium]|nr:MAG: aminotransferase class I/II-fold pyridoxal phosphate-dependent enzyme [Candidatus Woesebacteria bacterium]
MKPVFSDHFENIQPSVIRVAQIIFSKRKDGVKAINAAIGNVTLPIHPAMFDKMKHLTGQESPFAQGEVSYSATIGISEANKTLLHVMQASGIDTKLLFSQITDGGSMAMELVLAGISGRVKNTERPILTIDPTYANYNSFAKRLRRKTVSITRTLNNNGLFELPKEEEIVKAIKRYKPNAVLIIPYDNPTGQHWLFDELIGLTKIAVKNNLWIVSDEAYRELYFTKKKPVSIWSITEKMVPGITGRRISIESASKVWNACGLRIGAVVTDNFEFHEKCVAEQTANLCANTIGQYVYTGLLDETKKDLSAWFRSQRGYYKSLIEKTVSAFKSLDKRLIVSLPESSIYSVVDVKNITGSNFDATDFVKYCAKYGKVKMDDTYWTLLVSPMSGFYNSSKDKKKASTKMRLAYTETPDKIEKIPHLFMTLLLDYLRQKK